MPKLGTGLRKIPAARLIVLGELLLLAREHFLKLEPQERRRLVQLMRRGHGRPKNLSERERRELQRLLQKAEPRVFVGSAFKRVAGFGGPKRGTEPSE
jgi:hypothetical protein